MCIKIKIISVISSQLKLTKHLSQWFANFVYVTSVFVKTKFHPPVITKKLTCTTICTCVPSNFMANRRVPKFSLNNCAQSSKRTFMCPKFCTNSVLKYTKCHISTNLANFLKLWLLYCQKLFALAPTNRRFAEKNRLSGNTDTHISINIEFASVSSIMLESEIGQKPLISKNKFLAC